MLEDLGCEVEMAHDGTEALAKLNRDARIEALITDVNMPGMSGHDLVGRARDTRPGLKVILLSGAESDSRGFPLIRKPILQSDLVRVMRATIGEC